MSPNGHHQMPGFWTILTIVAASGAGLLSLVVSHAAEPKHSEAAHENAVNAMEVRVGVVIADVGHNSALLAELKLEIGDMRTEQRADTATILSAIRAN